MHASVSILDPRVSRQGFTLLEMCVVLFIIALMAGAAMPAMQSAFNERALRNDAHAFSLMAKEAMLRSGEEQRPYLINLQGRELVLEPASTEPRGDVAVPAATGTQTLDNALKLPDATTKNAWRSLPTVTWTFEPNSLCPLPRVRFERGAGYIEMSFNALTGDVEDEGYYLP